MLHNHFMAARRRPAIDVEPPAAADDRQWKAVVERDGTFDGRFVYAVSSTGVFCRPSCPSRRPRRERVRFYASAAAAVAAGYRACKRCDPGRAVRLPGADDAIRRAVDFLLDHADETVSLLRLARVAGLSAFHLQRRFAHALGVSPREFQAACRADRFRQALRDGQNVTAAIYAAGYGSPSRVYEATPTGRGMSPAAYRQGGAGAEIGYVTVRCRLGWLLVAATTKGVCAVKLGDSAHTLQADLVREYPAAALRPDTLVDSKWVSAVVDGLAGSGDCTTLPLDVRGTAFQWRVWRALQRIAPGETRSYTDVARAIGRPTAVRAVARACAANPVCLVIPCHRVVAKDGPGGYRWGASRKARLLEGEKKRSKIAAE